MKSTAVRDRHEVRSELVLGNLVVFQTLENIVVELLFLRERAAVNLMQPVKKGSVLNRTSFRISDGRRW